jgi:TolB-like protein
MQHRAFTLGFTLLLVGFSLNLAAQKKQEYRAVVNELDLKIQGSIANKLPLKIAVVPFTASTPTVQNRFGEYLTESVTGKLLENPNQFKVFERSRLDAIFKENELMLSGMVNTAEAMKIGKLLSVDALFSGTYTQLKSYIDVSGRLIDVETGEILTTYSGRIKMTKNLALLFTPIEPPKETSSNIKVDSPPAGNTTINIYNNTPPTTPATVEDCSIRDKAMRDRVDDLSTPDKIKSLVQDAIKIPFDNECGKFHYHMMGEFMRYKIHNDTYYNFLVRSLQDIPFTSRDERAQGIIEFITHDGTSEAEWKLTLETMARTEYSLYVYAVAAFKKPELMDSTVAKQWVDEYMTWANAGKIGKPEAFPYNKAFFQFMQGLGNRNHHLQVYLYDRYGSTITQEPVNTSNNHYLFLWRMYAEEEKPAIKTKIVKWMVDYFNRYQYKNSHDKLFDFAYDFVPEKPEEYNRKSVEDKNKERAITYPISDLKILIDLCRTKFTEYATKSEYSSTTEDRINFCLKYGIAVPGAIPTLEEANSILKGNDFDEQIRVMKLLVQMGERPKPLEPTLISILDRRSLDKKEDLQDVQNYALEILGNTKTNSLKVINLMIVKLKSFNYKEADNSQEALVKIGKPAVKPVMDRLSTVTLQEGGLQYKLVVILGRIGAPAKPAVPMLQKILRETKNPDVKYAAEAALQSII